MKTDMDKYPESVALLFATTILAPITLLFLLLYFPWWLFHVTGELFCAASDSLPWTKDGSK